jgi:hypothetical protein
VVAMKPGMVVVVLATGCLSIPPYQPEISVSYTEAGSGGTATGPDFILQFADGPDFHFPNALKIDGIDVMGHEMMPGCSDQDESGAQIAPTLRISPHSGAMIEKNQLMPVLRGPAVVQVRFEWATQFACGSIRTPGGTSTFTVFPDGRIVRHDTIDDPVTSMISSNNCLCDGVSASFNISTYWTLARTPNLSLYAPNASTKVDLPKPKAEVTNYDTACLDSGAYQVAFAWWHRPEDTTTAEHTAIHGGDMLIGVGRYAGDPNSVLGKLSLNDSSAMFIGHNEPDGCAKPIARAKGYVVPLPLMINESLTTPAAHNGIYGAGGGDGPFELGSGNDRAVLTGPTDSSFAVWLRFSHSVDAIRARREDATRPQYVPQQVDDDEWIVWFRDPLLVTQSITIDPI